MANGENSSARDRTPEPPSAPPGRARVRWNRARRVAAAALAAAFAVLLPAAITSAWIRGTILSTSGYVAAVAPAAASPAVRAAVQDAVISQVDAALSHAGASLRPPARVLAGPLGAGLAGLAGNGVSQLIASQAFQRLWADANRLAHSQLISVLNGDSALVAATGGEIVLNLLPLVNDVLQAVSRQLSAMTGGAMSLPPATTIRAAACHAITRTSSSACAQIPLFPAAALAGPRRVYRILVAMTPLVLMLTVLALAGALAASPRRRRTLLQMTIGGTLALLAVMTAVSWGQSSLIDRAAPRYQAVTSVLVHAFTTGFFTMTTWCVAGGVAVTAIALLPRPCRLTTAIRAALRIEPDRDHGRRAHLPARPRARARCTGGGPTAQARVQLMVADLALLLGAVGLDERTRGGSLIVEHYPTSTAAELAPLMWLQVMRLQADTCDPWYGRYLAHCESCINAAWPKLIMLAAATLGKVSRLSVKNCPDLNPFVQHKLGLRSRGTPAAPQD
jgi:hypothetical protein